MDNETTTLLVNILSELKTLNMMLTHCVVTNEKEVPLGLNVFVEQPVDVHIRNEPIEVTER